MVLLGDELQAKARFRLFEDSANLDARPVPGLHRTYHRLKKSFYTHPMKFLGDMGHVESHFSLFGDSASVGAR
jgi:hypothetical protein